MRKAPPSASPDPSPLRARARQLGLYGLLARWDELCDEPWLEKLLSIEDDERRRRSLERRLRNARIGSFQAMADFDWSWPRKVDRSQIEDILDLGFMNDLANVVLLGPNGVGKTTIAQNIAHQAVLRGHTVRFTTASALLNDLAEQDTSRALTRRLHRYCSPSLLVVDEVGYLSYDARHGDLLFEVVSRRNGLRPIVLTTNRTFSEWNEVFPNSSCVTALIDRLVHKAEITTIDGDSCRAKEARERAEQKAKDRKAKTKERERKQ